MRHQAKFRADRSNFCGDMTHFRFFKMAAVHHLGFVLRVFAPSTKSICWSLSLCKIWLESVQYSFDNMPVLMFNASLARKCLFTLLFKVFWGI